MKKLIVISVMFALISGAVFAQTAEGIIVNAWGRGAFSPLQVEFPAWENGKAVKDSEVQLYAGKGTTWGTDAIRVDFRMLGNSPWIGFGFNATVESDALAGNDDAAFIWAKPFNNEYLKIKIGMFIEDELRGKFGGLNNTFHRWVLPGIKEEDDIFSRFSSSNMGHLNSSHLPTNGGVLLTSKPIPNLFLGLMFNGNINKTSAIDSYRYMQAAVGYNFTDYGIHARAQYIGGFAGSYSAKDIKDIDNDGSTGFNANNPSRIETAFAITAIPGFLIDLGGKIWLPIEQEGGVKSNNGISAALGLLYIIDDIGINFRVDAGNFGAYDRDNKDNKLEDSVTFDVRLNPYYVLDFATVGGLFGLNMKTNSIDKEGKEAKDGTFQVGFGGYIQKGLGKGSIKAGVTYMVAPLTRGGLSGGAASGRDLLSIPIILEYAFF